jgi:phage terminase large subunit GpA-like protein
VAPYLVEVMDSCLEPGIEQVTLQKCSQMGGSEVLNNIIGYFMHQDPAPILFVTSGDKEAKAYSKERIAKMIDATPVLRARIEVAGGDDTTLSKDFTGGHLAVAGANAPAGLRSRPRRVILLDEVDSYPPSAGDEGDPVGLAEARTRTFWNRVIVKVSTPTLEGLSRIEAAVNDADEIRLYCVPCPHCAHMQHLRFAQLKWEKSEGKHLPETAEYLCESCGALIPERRKGWMNAHGEWRPHRKLEKEEQDATIASTWGTHWEPCERKSRVKSVAFTGLNALYSPWMSWEEVVTDFLAKKSDRMRLQVWVNTVLGEVFREAGYQLDANPLMRRQEVYPENPVPPGVLLITAGVDVQADRLEVELVGWGIGYENWSLDFIRIPGDPSLEGGVWSTLDHVLARTFDHPAGVKLRIFSTAIDSGFMTQEVYRYCSTRFAANVWAVKGIGEEGRAIWDKPSNRNKYKVPLYPIGVDTAKTAFYAHLRVQRPRDWTGGPVPGYCHFPARAPYDEEYFRQLTSEKVVIRQTARNVLKRQWIRRPGRRAEGLDCRIYAFAAHEGAFVSGIRLEQIKQAIDRGGAPEQTRRIRRRGEQPG